MPVQEIVVKKRSSLSPEQLYVSFFEKVFLPPSKDQSIFMKINQIAAGDEESKIGLIREIKSIGMQEKIISTSEPNLIEYSIVQAGCGCISPAKDYKARIEFTRLADESETEVIWSSEFKCSNFSAAFIKPFLRSQYRDMITQLQK